MDEKRIDQGMKEGSKREDDVRKDDRIRQFGTKDDRMGGDRQREAKIEREDVKKDDKGSSCKGTE